ncbi:MAG: molybdopterin molybdotransferase MoeA [Syntrophobacteraceae bacterium]|nr:molybdopterin molybdotransferase MoeA [Syntrophobacteraceae bacterium]
MIRHVPEASSELVALEDALGRVAARDLRAPRDLPAESRSRLDGYALRSLETLDATEARPVRCRLTPWSVPAGHAPRGRLEAGCCARVMTGAMIPAGADAVVAEEVVCIQGDHLLLVRPVSPASGLVREGADALDGELLAARGEVLTPSRLAMVAAFGMDRVPVAVRPRAALLSTGDEVREPGSPHDPGISYSNNRHLLGWLTRLNGGLVTHLGVSGDDPVEVSECLDRVEADLVLTTGGTGRGDRDVVVETWSRLGVQTAFRGVGLSPGKGVMAGFKGGRAYLALPGSPWGGRIILEELIKPFLWRFQGFSCRWPLTIKARLEDRVDNGQGICRALAGELKMKGSTASFIPLTGWGASVFGQVRRSIGYMILEPHVLEITAGTEVNVRLFDLPLLAAAILADSQCNEP